MRSQAPASCKSPAFSKPNIRTLLKRELPGESRPKTPTPSSCAGKGTLGFQSYPGTPGGTFLFCSWHSTVLEHLPGHFSSMLQGHLLEVQTSSSQDEERQG